MILAIHHPQYLPPISWFARLRLVDVMVLLDDIPMPDRNREAFINRNRVRTHDRALFLTVPVIRTPRHTLVNETRINPTATGWSAKHFRTITQSYSRAGYMEYYNLELQRIYNHEWKLLIDLNMELIGFLLDVLGIRRNQLLLSSSLGLPSNLYTPVGLSKEFGASEYMAGPLEVSRISSETIQQFRDNGIKMTQYKWQCPLYEQCFNSFIPNLSALDLILNEGTSAASIVMSAVQSRV